MEVLLNQSTTILSSPRQIQNPVSTSTTADGTTLAQVQGIQIYQQVSVSIKVLEVLEKSEIKSGLVKQDVTISDATGTIRLTMWQENVDKLQVGVSYKIDNLTVRSYNDTKYLTPPKSGCTITPLAR